MKCKNCGAKISRHSSYCISCGNVVEKYRAKDAVKKVMEGIFRDKKPENQLSESNGLTPSYCKYCKVEIGGGLNKCPLCHEPVQPSGESEVFMKRKFRKTRKVYSFTAIYTFVALAVIAMLAVLNGFYSDYLWPVPAVILIFYGYLFVKNTVLYKGSVSCKIFWQTFVLLALVSSVLGIIYAPAYLYFYILSSMLILSIVIQVIFLFIYHKRLQEYTLYLSLTCILCFVPIIVASVLGYAFYEIVIPCCLAGGLVLLAILFFARKEFAAQFSKIFHL